MNEKRAHTCEELEEMKAAREREFERLKNAPTEPPPPPDAPARSKSPLLDRVMAHALQMAVQLGATKAELAFAKKGLAIATQSREKAVAEANAELKRYEQELGSARVALEAERRSAQDWKSRALELEVRIAELTSRQESTT